MCRNIITLNGISISYLVANPAQSKTIFYVHGNSNSADLWQKQMSDPSLANYRHIAFDLPAHGASGNSAEPDTDYAVTGLGQIIATGIKALAAGSENVIIGISLGTNVVAEALAFALPVQGVILVSPYVIGGAYTLQSIINPAFDTSILFTDIASEQSLHVLFRSLLSTTDEETIKLFVEDFQIVRAPFRSAVLQTYLDGKISDEIQILKELQLPVLIIFGSDDPTLHTNYLDGAGIPLWRNKIIQMPGISHFPNWQSPDDFNSLLAAYCKEII